MEELYPVIAKQRVMEQACTVGSSATASQYMVEATPFKASAGHIKPSEVLSILISGRARRILHLVKAQHKHLATCCIFYLRTFMWQ
jgi:hypothetical protein